jgi:WD40 repeat protein
VTWASADPYLLRHLAAHAGAGGHLAELVADPWYLVHADPLRLSRVLGTVDHRQHLLARLYWRVLDRLRDATLRQRAAILQAAALEDEPEAIGLLPYEGVNCAWRPLWATGTPTPFHRRFTGHVGSVHALAIEDSDTQPIVVSGGEDGYVRVWDLMSGEQRQVLVGHAGAVRALTVGKLGGRRVVVSGSEDQTIRVWDLANSEEDAVLAGHTSAVRALAMGELDGRPVIVSAGDDGTIRVWDSVTREQRILSDTGDARVSSLAYGVLEQRAVIAAGVGHRRLVVYDLATADEVVVLYCNTTDRRGLPRRPPYGIHAVMFTRVRDRPLLVSAGADDSRTNGAIQAWDVGNGAETTALVGHVGAARALAQIHDGDHSLVVSGGEDNTVRVWELGTGKPMATWMDIGEVCALAVGKIGARHVAVSAGDHGPLRVWDVALEHSEPSMRAVALGTINDRLVVVSGGEDHTVRVWDGRSGQELNLIRGHGKPIEGVALARFEGRDVIVSVGGDRTLRIWNGTTGAERWVKEHRYLLRALAVGTIEDDTIVVYGDAAGAVYAWYPSRDGLDELVTADHLRDIRAVALGTAGTTTAVFAAGIERSDDSEHPLGGFSAAGGGYQAVARHYYGWRSTWYLSGRLPHPPSLPSGVVTALAAGGTAATPLIAHGYDHGAVCVGNLANGALYPNLTCAGRWVQSVAIGGLKGRAMVVAASKDIYSETRSYLQVWDVVTGAEHARMTYYTNAVRQIATWSDPNVLLVAVATDRRIQVVAVQDCAGDAWYPN